MILVPLEPEVRDWTCRAMRANFGFGALGRPKGPFASEITLLEKGLILVARRNLAVVR